MPNVALTLACVDYLDRTRPIIDRQAETPDLDLTCISLPPRELGSRWAEFDVAETIVPVYMALRSRGDNHFVGIPVFPYRAFFLGNIIVNASAGIERPEDLAGKRVGTSGLHLAGTLWLRGILEDTYGVKGSQLHWFTSGKPRIELPPDMRVEVVPPERTLSDMLDQGEIDAWIGSSRPECFERRSPRVRRLFPNYRQVEEDYARRTGFFPILHMILVRRALYEEHPWIAERLFQVFQQARQIGLTRLTTEGVPTVGLPWLSHDLEELPTIFGGDWYRYGFEANREILTTMARYAADQGVTPRRVDVAELFAAETLR
jgi:4,5-dihydroxyphthalate decarboxylase